MNVDDAVICRLKKNGLNFEILVDCDKTMDFKHGKEVDIEDVIVGDDIFKDVKKGEHASEHDLRNVFSTDDKKLMIRKILKNGDVQLTTEYKNKLRDEKKKAIISLISRNAVDPKTNIPHPPQRVENAMNEARVNIDEFKSAEQQVGDIVKQIISIIPIAYELRKLELTIPADVSGRAYPVLKQLATILNETWNNDGSLTVNVEVPAGLQNELFDKLNGIAHGRIESKNI
ncbi:ribosome assembly factor SBDS [Candidatus Woesearchaeota archaeon]|jgi:ribosome maturation protein SDO1|nr:ribosome assembly factor SBDS [Candidatus Woesearchaeota archaeon]MBT7238274.1 ribosome assembly factor SBDS [Candidatus Woesearchaeota archaeon]